MKTQLSNVGLTHYQYWQDVPADEFSWYNDCVQMRRSLRVGSNKNNPLDIENIDCDNMSVALNTPGRLHFVYCCLLKEMKNNRLFDDGDAINKMFLELPVILIGDERDTLRCPAIMYVVCGVPRQIKNTSEVTPVKTKWFTDTTIDCYINLLIASANTGEPQEVKIFDRSFFSLLSSNKLPDKFYNDESLRHKKYILIPMSNGSCDAVYADGDHYYLVFIELSSKQIYCYDSSMLFKPGSSPSFTEVIAKQLETIKEYAQKLSGQSGWSLLPQQGPALNNNYDCGVFMLASVVMLFNTSDKAFFKTWVKFKTNYEFIHRFRCCVLFSILSNRLLYPLTDFNNVDKSTSSQKVVHAQGVVEPSKAAKKTTSLWECIQNSGQVSGEQSADMPLSKPTCLLKIREMKAWLHIHGIQFIANGLREDLLLNKIIPAVDHYEFVIELLKSGLIFDAEKNNQANEVNSQIESRLQKITSMNHLPNGDEQKLLIEEWSCNSNTKKCQTFDDGTDHVICHLGRQCFFLNSLIHNTTQSQKCLKCGNNFHFPFCIKFDHCYKCLKDLGNGLCASVATSSSTTNEDLINPLEEIEESRSLQELNQNFVTPAHNRKKIRMSGLDLSDSDVDSVISYKSPGNESQLGLADKIALSLGDEVSYTDDMGVFDARNAMKSIIAHINPFGRFPICLKNGHKLYKGEKVMAGKHPYWFPLDSDHFDFGQEEVGHDVPNQKASVLVTNLETIHENALEILCPENQNDRKRKQVLPIQATRQSNRIKERMNSK